MESCCVCQPNVDLSLEINYCFKIKKIACGNGRREVFSPLLTGTEISHRSWPCTSSHRSEGERTRGAACQVDSSWIRLAKRLLIEKVRGIGMWTPCHEDLVIMVLKIEQMVSVAVQLDTEGFVTEQTNIPQDKESSCQLTLSFVHRISLTLNVTLSYGHHLGLVSTFMANIERILTSRWSNSRKQALQGQSGKMFPLMNVPWRLFGPNGTSWSSEIKYCVEDSVEVVPELSTKKLARGSTRG